MIFVIFLFCFIQAYAKTPPIPEALLNAKTAVVVNRGADAKDLEKLSKCLKEWGRFELVQDQKSADIVITIYTRLSTQTIQTVNVGMSGGVNSIQVLTNYLSILDARTGEELYSDKTTPDSKDPRQLVSNLKNRMKKK
jgi:hypothetical protein